MNRYLAQVSIFDQFFRNHSSAVNAGGSVGQLVSTLLPNIIIFAGIFFFILIIYAGYQLIILGGQYNPPAVVAKAKSMVTYALIGFLLVLSAYFILQIVSTITGVNFINPNVS